jgi:hypothetical protein
MPLPFVTPNQMSEHAQRRDPTRLRHSLNPCRGLGCARGGADSQSQVPVAKNWSKRARKRATSLRIRQSKSMAKEGSLPSHQLPPTGHHLIPRGNSGTAKWSLIRLLNSLPIWGIIYFSMRRNPTAARARVNSSATARLWLALLIPKEFQFQVSMSLSFIHLKFLCRANGAVKCVPSVPALGAGHTEFKLLHRLLRRPN